jgi:alpha-glucosidase
LSYANNTLHASVSGDFNDHLPLANVTIVGVKGNAGGGGGTVNCGHGEGHAHTGWGAEHGDGTSGVRSRSENGVVYITGLEDATSGGVWNEDLEIIVE